MPHAYRPEMMEILRSTLRQLETADPNDNTIRELKKSILRILGDFTEEEPDCGAAAGN